MKYKKWNVVLLSTICFPILFFLLAGCSYYAEKGGLEKWQSQIYQGMPIDEIIAVFKKENIDPEEFKIYPVTQPGELPEELRHIESILCRSITTSDMERMKYVYFIDVGYGWIRADWLWFFLDETKRLIAFELLEIY